MLKSASALLLLAACALSHAAAPSLKYDQKKRTVSLTANGRTIMIDRFLKNEGPELVGMEKFIRILPPGLQPYGDRGILLLNTARRSSSGDGGGQCGGGSEMHLHAVDLNKRPPRQVGKVLVGSCWEDLYPDETPTGPDDFSGYSVENGSLRIRFLGRSARLAENLNELEFDNEKD